MGMLIAKVENGVVTNVADYQSMYPNVVFPSTGPTEGWMIDNGCMYVNTYVPYDPATQVLIPANPPYIEIPDPANQTQWVYTVTVREMTPEEKQQYDDNLRQQNKAAATQLLYETDWTTIPDVGNPHMSNPYLTNVADFVLYRNALRQIAVYPPITVDEWPTKPDEQWTDVPQ